MTLTLTRYARRVYPNHGREGLEGEGDGDRADEGRGSLLWARQQSVISFGEAGTDRYLALFMLLSALLRLIRFSAGFPTGFSSSSFFSLVLFKEEEWGGGISSNSDSGRYCCCFCCCWFCCCTFSDLSCCRRGGCCSSDNTSCCWGKSRFIVFRLLFAALQTPSRALSVAVAAVVVDCDCVVTFLPGTPSTCARGTTWTAEGSTSFHYYQHPFFFSAHQYIGDFAKVLVGYFVIWRAKSPVEMPDLLITVLTSIWPHLAKKRPPFCLPWCLRVPHAQWSGARYISKPLQY